MADSRFEGSNPFSEKEILEIERTLGRKLPKDYLDFTREYGGAFAGGLVDGSNELPILSFMKADGVLSTMATHPDLIPDGVMPFASCEMGNHYVLDSENTIHYINYYGGTTNARKVANSFGEFIDRIVVQDELPPDMPRP